MKSRALLLAGSSTLSLFLALACGGGDDSGGATPAGSAGSAGSGSGACMVPGDEAQPGEGPPLLSTDCDPISSRCGFPFPSNVYLVDDASKKTPSGKSVQFGKTSLPRYRGDKDKFDTTLLTDMDGFSPGAGALMYIPGATATGFANPLQIDTTTKPDSPSILMDAETGELVPHWVDLDMSPRDDEERALIVRPAVRLKDKTRYIVALRRVVDVDGKAIEPTPAWKALRDGTPGCHPSVELRRDLYKDIFAKLEAKGIAKGDLQVAWDYTTSSKENTTRWAVKMRDDALANYGDASKPFKYQVIKVEDNPNKFSWKRVHVQVTLPSYLNTAANWRTPADTLPRINVGPDGLPVQNGEFQWDVLIHIPKTAEAGGKKYGLLQNGHGLFGSRFEGQNGYLPEMGNLHDWVTFSVDLMGFSEPDVEIAIAGLGGNNTALRAFTERQIQGMLNQQLAMRFMMTTFANDPLLLDKDGKSIVDTSLRAYRGDSQGGIMGTAYMALSVDVTRGLVGEPGMPYNLLLNRSKDYSGYQLVLNGSYPNGLDQQVLLGAFQMLWDRSEPMGYAPYITKDMLPGTPAHQILIHDALGDQQVTTLGAHIIARTVDAKAITPAVRPIYGIQEAATVMGGSAIVEYKFPLKDEPLVNRAPSDNPDPHDMVRELGPSYDQSDWFFRTGEIKAFCKGICSCRDAEPEVNCERSDADFAKFGKLEE
ncbi:MAG: hypothetical protein IT374_00130 [Polyangiaceae bacterium]|nr:hypothetical protein [Polyangiaceae bacterium]